MFFSKHGNERIALLKWDDILELLRWVAAKDLLQYEFSRFAEMVSFKILMNRVHVLMKEIAKAFREGDPEWEFARSELVDLDSARRRL